MNPDNPLLSRVVPRKEAPFVLDEGGFWVHGGDDQLTIQATSSILNVPLWWQSLDGGDQNGDG